MDNMKCLVVVKSFCLNKGKMLINVLYMKNYEMSLILQLAKRTVQTYKFNILYFEFFMGPTDKPKCKYRYR